MFVVYVGHAPQKFCLCLVFILFLFKISNVSANDQRCYVLSLLHWVSNNLSFLEAQLWHVNIMFIHSYTHKQGIQELGKVFVFQVLIIMI